MALLIYLLEPFCIFPCMQTKRSLLFLVGFLFWCTALSGQLIYAVTSQIPTQLVVIDLSNGCQFSAIGPVLDTNGNPVSGLDIAICPNGTIYITDAFNLYSVNPLTAQATLIGSLGGAGVNSLACNDMNELFGASAALFQINTSTGLATNLGPLPEAAGGDIVFYDGTAYYASFSGLYEINFNNPGASQLIMGTNGTQWGLSGYYNSCTQLISNSPGGDIYLLDPDAQTQILLCQVPISITGMASLDDFNPPINCDEFTLDLDGNNSSGASGFNFNASDIDCANTSTPIADVDASIISGSIISTMTITIASGMLDGPLEFLTLNPVPGILVLGSGTSTITLVNQGGTNIATFLSALTAVLYENSAAPPTPGLRTIEVSFTTINADLSNTAVANINVFGSNITVDLGPSQFLCEGEIFTLDAGNPGLNYLWSTGQQTQTIDVSDNGLYSVTVSDANGCTATDEVLITFLPNTTVTISGDESICIGETATLTITVNGPAPVNLIIQNVNTGQLFPLNGVGGVVSFPVVPFSTNTYIISSVTASGGAMCVDPVPMGTATVTVGFTTLEAQDLEICMGDSLFVGNNWQTEPGVYFDTLMTSLGCDSVLITTLNVTPADSTFVDGITCDPNAAGTSQQLYSNSNGCDSLVIETLVFGGSPNTIINQTSCDPNSVGSDTLQLMNAAGCDSLLITITSFLESDTTYFSTITCDQTQAGFSEELLQNQLGCDSLVITEVLFFPADTTYLTGASCDPAQTGVFEELLQNASGCDSLLITTIDLLPSDTVFLDSLTCNSSEVGITELLLQNQFGCDSLIITTTELIPADTTNLSVSSCDPAAVGTVEVLLQNAFGCDSLVITTTSLLPSDTVNISASSCDPNQSGVEELLLQNQFGCDSLVIITTTFAEADSTQIQLTSCNPMDVGQEIVVLQSSDGCDSLIITTTSLLPSDTTNLSSSTCDPNEVGITEVILQNTFGCDSLVITTTSLLPSDTTYITIFSCSVLDTGLVVSNLTNQFGCDSLIFLQTNLSPPSDCMLEALAANDLISCDDNLGMLIVQLLDGTGPYTWSWTNQFGDMQNGLFNGPGNELVLSDLPPGTYTINLEDSGGLMTSLLAEVAQTLPPVLDLTVVSDYNGFAISCPESEDGAVFAEVVSGGVPPIFYNWSNGFSQPLAEDLAAGWAMVTVSDSYGCTRLDSIFLTPPDSLRFELFLSDPDCFDESAGVILLEDISGGVMPYQYALNGGAWQADSLFENLESGNYLIELEDANGCTAQAYALINSVPEILVELGLDSTLLLGDSITLTPIINLPFDQLDTIYWSGVDCPDCESVTVGPIITSSYSVTVVDSLGCRATDELTLQVQKELQVFVPNIFSPDGNGINDRFTIYAGPMVELIREFRIFSRWGEPVFHALMIPPNTPSQGWNGMFRGELMNPAVFVYWAELELVDGTTVIIKGDVSLLR